MGFTARATGGASTADRDEVRRALGILIDPAQASELVGLPSGRSRPCAGSDLDAAARAAQDLSDGAGVYFRINPCRPGLSKSANNGDIIARRWLLVDCDPVRPSGENATDAEKAAGIEQARAAGEFLASHGWPDPLWVDSGNGVQLLYRIDLPAETLSRQWLKAILAKIGDETDTDASKVDRAVHRANQLAKLPGTWARKGPHSPERPHRMARLVSVPTTIEVVTAELLGAMAGMAAGGTTNRQPKGGSSSPPPSATAPSNGHANGHATANPWGAKATAHTLDGYVRSAIRRECAVVEMTPQGDRNNALNTAAFNLGTMADWPEMDHADAKLALWEAAKRAGLEDEETRKTIASGWDSGAAKGRVRPPEKNKPNYSGATQPPPKPFPPGQKMTVGLDEVTEEDVDWIYENILAIGFISIFAGQTSQGKSFVVCDLISRLTRGEKLPFSEDQRPPTAVLMISEDPLEQMLAPRLNEMGARKDLVRFLTWEAMATYTLEDTAMLDRAWLECKQPTLLIIDPPQNFMGKADEHRNSEVRVVLMRVVAWLQKRLAACVLIMHVNKQVGKGLAALDRIMGSVAWATTPRIAMGFSDDPDVPGQHIMAGVKNNLGPKAQARTYKIVKTSPKRARIEWGTLVDITADDALNQVKKVRSTNAAMWLAELFRQQLEWPSVQFWDAAKQNGISKNSIDEARAKLGMPKPRKSMTPDGNVCWTWWVSPDWKYLGEDPQ